MDYRFVQRSSLRTFWMREDSVIVAVVQVVNGNINGVFIDDEVFSNKRRDVLKKWAEGRGIHCPDKFEILGRLTPLTAKEVVS